MARRSARQMADQYYPPLSISEQDTWAHTVDYSLPKMGIAALVNKIGRRLRHGRKQRHS